MCSPHVSFLSNVIPKNVIWSLNSISLPNKVSFCNDPMFIFLLENIMALVFKVEILKPRGWSGGAKVLGKLSVPGLPTIWINVGQGPIALAVGAGGGCLDLFTLIYPFFLPSPSLWETARYRLKYCLKGPLNPKQPTNQPILKPQSWDHISISSRADWILLSASLGDECLVQIALSFANWESDRFGTSPWASSKVFIMTLNKMGLRTLPWGQPFSRS